MRCALIAIDFVFRKYAVYRHARAREERDSSEIA